MFLAPALAEDELGRLGGFRILKVLGAGGMGVVFLGEDPKLGRKVAIKAMLPNLAQSTSSEQRFLREARAAAALEHDHIVAIHHVGEDRGAPFIVMPFLKGEPLDERLKRGDPMPLAEILRIGREIAEGLDAAHQHGLIHRDIKPANIWLEAPRSRVKILDFGLVRAAVQDSNLTQQGAIIGTPTYMAPEQGRGRNVDSRCDLFSLGVVLYRMTTGQLPFHGADTVSALMSVAMHNPLPPININADLPAELSDLVMKLLEKDLDKRIASAGEVIAALLQMEDDLKQHKAIEDKTQATTFVPPENKATARKNLASGDMVSANATPRRNKPLVMMALLLLGGLFVLAGGIVGVIRIASPEGDYVIDTDEPDFAVSVSKGNVILEDKLKKRTYHLKVVKQGRGEFELEVTDPGNELTFNTKTFRIKRGEKVALKAWFERKLAQIDPPQKGDGAPIVKSGEWQPMPFGKSPLDALDPAGIPPEERFDWQPKELVAVLGSHRQRQWYRSTGVAISADGIRVAAASLSSWMTIWDFETAQKFGELGRWRYPALSADGKWLFDMNHIRDVDRWREAQKKNPVAELKDSVYDVEDAGYPYVPQFSMNGTYFALERNDPIRVILWRIGKDARRIGEWPDFFSPALSLDGKMLAMVHTKDLTIHLFDIQGDKVKPRGALLADDSKAPGPLEGASYLRFAHDGRLGVLANDRKSISFWFVAGPTPQKLGSVAIDSNHGSFSFRFAANAPRIVAFDQTGFDLWRLTEKGAEREPAGHVFAGAVQSSIAEVAISADGNRLVAGHSNGAVLFWEVKDGRLAQRNPLTPQPVESGEGGTNAHFSPAGDYLTTRGEAGTTLWRFGGKSPKGSLYDKLGTPEYPASAFFSKDAFAVGHGSESTVRAWHATATAIKEIGERSLLGYAFVPLASAESGMVLARFFHDKHRTYSGRLLDMSMPNAKPGDVFEIGAFAPSNHPVVAMSADGRVFASAVTPPDGKTDTNTIRVFDIQDGKVTKRYDVATNIGNYGAKRIRLSRDGQWLAAAGSGAYRLWHLESEAAKLDRTGAGEAGSFSPNGKQLAVFAEYNQKLEIRDVETWEVVWSKRIPGGTYDAVFAPDGRHLLIGNANHGVHPAT